jgi:hypothetical protein
MQPDPELDAWRQQWQARDGVPADLTARVQRELRHARLSWVIAIGITIGFGVMVPIRAYLTRRPDDIVLAVSVWGFIALAWIVSLRIMRGASEPAAATTAAYLDFSILSCRRHLAEIRSAAILYVVLLTFVMGLNYPEFVERTGGDVWTFLTLPASFVVWGVTAALGVFGLWRRRQLRRELNNLIEIRRRQN